MLGRISLDWSCSCLFSKRYPFVIFLFCVWKREWKEHAATITSSTTDRQTCNAMQQRMLNLDSIYKPRSPKAYHQTRHFALPQTSHTSFHPFSSPAQQIPLLNATHTHTPPLRTAPSVPHALSLPQPAPARRPPLAGVLITPLFHHRIITAI